MRLPARMGSSSGSVRLLTCVGIQTVEFVGVDALHDPRREQSLEEPPDPCGALPSGGDAHREVVPCGVTVNVVTRLDVVSVSVSTRPGSGSVTFIRYSRLRPPAVTVKRVIVPSPTPPVSTSKAENAGGRNRGWCSRMSAR
jgi:hypothetical protein